MLDKIKLLREETGASIGEIRSALEESGGDLTRAREAMKRKFGAMAEKKASREVKAGVIEAYVHSDGRLGALVELLCETDFVARHEDFRRAAHDIAMHIAAAAPADSQILLEQEFYHPAHKLLE